MDAHVETCGLTAYRPPSVPDACGAGDTACYGQQVVPYDPPEGLVTITSITIAARSPNVDTLTIPSTMDTRGYPLTNDYYTFDKRLVTVGKRKTLEVDMTLSKPVANLVTFGIYQLLGPTRS